MRRIVLVFVASLVAAAALNAKAWQSRLDKATLGVDVPFRSRLRFFRKAVQDPALRDDVLSAVTTIREKGIAKGHPEVIDLLWPTGTTARADIEGLVALRKQVPELLQDLQEQPLPDLQLPDLAAAPELPDPAAALSSIASLASDRSRQNALKEEAKDLLRRTPKGLETPKYDVLRVIDGPVSLGKPEPIELRKYAEFTVARTTMKAGFGSTSGSDGFNTLASYLFGGNQAKESMAMTMPVEVSTRGGDATGSMAFVLPTQSANAPPIPLAGSDVTIDTVPERLVAVKAFGGIVTEEEVARQRAALLSAIEADGSVEVEDASAVSVLQYNSPLTIPWRRRNEVAIVVTLTDQQPIPAAAADEEPADLDKLVSEEISPSGVVSWYDAGFRI